LKASYVPVPDATQLDSIAYLNLTEIVRYKRIIERHTSKYEQIDTAAADRKFFEGNLSHSIQLKLQGDRKRDNAIYRIAASSISASVEDLISILIDKFNLAGPSSKEDRRTFGQKLRLIESRIESSAPPSFDKEFFRRFNDFILYLRNSSTHKSTMLLDIEKFKAELSTKLTFPFIEFYNDIVYPLLADGDFADRPMKIKRLLGSDIDAHDVFYFGLDGDNTGSILEELFLSACDEVTFKRMSSSITKAINEIVRFVKANFLNSDIVFYAGDDILFKGCFSEVGIHTLQQMYQNITSGMTCSIGYGKSFQEVYLALKLAKAEPGKNSIVGVELV